MMMLAGLFLSIAPYIIARRFTTDVRDKDPRDFKASDWLRLACGMAIWVGWMMILASIVIAIWRYMP